jgi:hypothetical protein
MQKVMEDKLKTNFKQLVLPRSNGAMVLEMLMIKKANNELAEDERMYHLLEHIGTNQMCFIMLKVKTT